MSTPAFTADPVLQLWLEDVLAEHGAISGTVHLQRGEDLVLAAQVRLPPPVIGRVLHVPHGKGMAGAAQLARAPVQSCNIQTDDSGTLMPAAKLVAAKAAVAVPVLREGAVHAVVGFAFDEEGELGADRVATLDAAAHTLPG